MVEFLITSCPKTLMILKNFKNLRIQRSLIKTKMAHSLTYFSKICPQNEKQFCLTKLKTIGKPWLTRTPTTQFPTSQTNSTFRRSKQWEYKKVNIRNLWKRFHKMEYYAAIENHVYYEAVVIWRKAYAIVLIKIKYMYVYIYMYTYIYIYIYTHTHINTHKCVFVCILTTFKRQKKEEGKNLKVQILNEEW